MKRIAWLLLTGLLAYAATGLYFVQPDEQAIVRRFGQALGPPREPGAHFGLPWGLDRVQRIKPREVKRVTVGPVSLGGQAVGANVAQYLTGDRNLVNVRATIQYTIADPARYLFGTPAVDPVLAKAGEAALTEVLAGQPVDLALTLGKQKLSSIVHKQLEELADRYGLGVRISSVDIGSVAAPAEVAEAFEKVISALRERDQQINQSQSYANRTLAEAQASAQRFHDEAQGFRDRTIQQATGEAARFGQLLAEYDRAPALTAQRLYLETVAEVLATFRSKLIVAQGSDLDVSIFGQENR